jgi:hypothetical protein
MGRAEISTVVSAARPVDFTVHATLLSDTHVIYYEYSELDLMNQINNVSYSVIKT